MRSGDLGNTLRRAAQGIGPRVLIERVRTGSEWLGKLWGIVIVATAALMLIGATNTGFAGARGLWVTMARDNLLPRLVLDTNDRGVFSRINTLFLLTIILGFAQTLTA